MFRIAKPFYIICQTPTHCGSGQDLGIVDMPIQRERHTGFPKIEGSSLKGAIREVFEERLGQNSIKNESIKLSFGPEEGDAHAGALGFTDARILLFPVKSVKGVFAYITCPDVLNKFEKELKISKIEKINCEQEKSEIAISLGIKVKEKECIVANDSKVKVDSKNVILEEYCFAIENLEAEDIKRMECIAEILTKLTKIENLKEKLVILTNDDFTDFVNLSTEVITRTKIDNKTGTVAPGALFTEEYLPCETILYSLALASPIFVKEDKAKGAFQADNSKKEEEKVMEFFISNIPEYIQIGGNATIGKGIVKVVK